MTVVPLEGQVLGDGPPLIVLHGLFGSSRNWLGTTKRLAALRTAHLLDLRNHGVSPHAAATDYVTLAADVLAYMDRAGLDRADLFGHSMGGKTSMATALSAPERVTRLIVVDIAPVAYPRDHVATIEAMMRLDLGTISRRAEADAALAAGVPDTATRLFLLQNLASGPDGLSWRLGLANLLAGQKDIMTFPASLAGRRFEGPTLLLRGEHSDYVNPDGSAAMRRFFPAVEEMTITDAGHLPHVERPAEFLAAVEPFLLR